MRIFRTLFVVTAAVLLIPSPPESGTSIAGNDPSEAELLGAAFSAVADMGEFCARQPAVCTTAGYVAGKLEAKAKHGVKLIYEWANEGVADPATVTTQANASDAIETGSTTIADAEEAAPAQTTLTLDDLVPDWRGPRKS